MLLVAPHRRRVESSAAMSKPFDATMRKLIELEPAAWLRFLHVRIADPASVHVIDSNVSTVSAEADKVLWVDDPWPWIEHVELQAGRDTDLPDRLHWYNTSLGRSHKVPVHTTIVLLRAAADGPEMNGIHEKRSRNGDVYGWFRYDIVRIWQHPVAEVLASGLPVLPLAPVADVEPVCWWRFPSDWSARRLPSRRQRSGQRPKY
jgi:hypothetical protein